MSDSPTSLSVSGNWEPERQTDRERVLQAIRDSGRSWSADDVSNAFDLGTTEAYWLLSGLASEGLLDTGRGKGGVTTYGAVQPGTWIPWSKRSTR